MAQQITINVDNPSVMRSLRTLLRTMEGVTIIPNTRKKGSLDAALSDVKSGRTIHVGTVENLMKFLDE